MNPCGADMTGMCDRCGVPAEPDGDGGYHCWMQLTRQEQEQGYDEEEYPDGG